MDPVEEIKSRLDIVDIVSETVNLRRTGKNYIGFCPFHDNKHTPSFVVFPETGTWRCFSCNIGGDIFTFVMKREGWDFKQALEYLAERAGVPLKPRSAPSKEEREAHQRLYDLMSEAVTFYRHHLHTAAGKIALDYLHRRGLNDETIEAFGLGYAPNSWDAAMEYFTAHGYSLDELVEVGLVTKRDDGKTYDRFRNRVMFPIRDVRGRAVGFGARTLDPEGVPKYLNSPQTPLFDKGRLLYGLDKAAKPIRKQNEVVIVEGYMDVIGLAQAGFGNAVSPMGTALTEAQMRLLKRYTRRIILALDPDAAGIRATLRSMDIARQSLSDESGIAFDPRGLIRHESRLRADLRAVLLPEGKDPDEIALADPDAWRQIIANAEPLIIFIMKTLAANRDLDDPKVKAEIAEQVLPLIYEVANPVERNTYIHKLAYLLKVDEDALLAWKPPTQKWRRRRTTPAVPQKAQAAAPAKKSVAAEPPPTVKLGMLVIGALLRDPMRLYAVERGLRERDLAPPTAEDFPTEALRALFAAVQEAANQEKAEPDDYLISTLDESLLEEAEACLALTEHLSKHPELALPEALYNLVRLRYEQVNAELEQLYFLLAEAQKAQDPESKHYLRRVSEAVQIRRKLDAALKKGFPLLAYTA